MSTPRNHHFVSRVHIENFFNSGEGKIFVYDKNLDIHYSKKSTKSIFREKDLNSKFNNGSIDHISLEIDLNQYFEKDFSKHLAVIKEFIVEYKMNSEVNEALVYFAKYGIIGEIRNPRHKKYIENSLDKVFSEIMTNATDELKKQLEESTSYRKEINYINPIRYSEFANEIIRLMGDLIFIIEIPKNENDYFLLPDFCAANRREKINTYFNPDVKEIAYIGLPLTSKIYLHFYSSKIKNIKPNSGIYEIDRESVNNLNKVNFEFCESKVTCESREYLTKFIKNVVQLRI